MTYMEQHVSFGTSARQQRRNAYRAVVATGAWSITWRSREVQTALTNSRIEERKRDSRRPGVALITVLAVDVTDTAFGILVLAHAPSLKADLVTS